MYPICTKSELEIFSLLWEAAFQVSNFHSYEVLQVYGFISLIFPAIFHIYSKRKCIQICALRYDLVYVCSMFHRRVLEGQLKPETESMIGVVSHTRMYYPVPLDVIRHRLEFALLGARNSYT